MSTGSPHGYDTKSWNPVTGCSKVSAGCKNCWAEQFSQRMGWPWKVTLHPERLDEPMHWRKPQVVAVAFMGDLFHEDVPDEFIDKVFATMALTPQHTYLLLTKRPGRMKAYMTQLASDVAEWPLPVEKGSARIRTATLIHCTAGAWPLRNVWPGTSIENQATADERIPLLLEMKEKGAASHIWISAEPLLEAVDLSPYLWYTPVDETEADRGNRLPSGTGRRTGDRRSGTRVAAGEQGLGSLEGLHPPESARAPTGREQDGQARIPPSPGYVELQTDSRNGPSSRLASLLRSDPAEHDSEPQERRQGGQPSREPRTGNLLGAGDSRAAHPEAGPTRSERQPQFNGEIECQPGRGNPQPEGTGRETNLNRPGLRHHLPNCLPNSSQTKTPTGIDFVVIGGESGPRHRPCDPAWIESIVRQCQAAGVKAYVKQASAARPGQQGDIPDELWAIKQMPCAFAGRRAPTSSASSSPGPIAATARPPHPGGEE